MQRTGITITIGVLITGVLSVLGCAGPNKTASIAPVQRVCEDTVTKAEVVQAAEYVLTRMQFPLEKLDAEQGLVRTRPLRGAQFFEFWRSDNVGAYDCTEASLQSIRRSVELRVRMEDRGRRTEDGGDARLRVECAVAVQRLSLPGNEVTGVSAAYGIYARNTPTRQRLEGGRQPRRDMAWIDLGQDEALAARILDRIEKRLRHAD
jgi:hypothetical protein